MELFHYFVLHQFTPPCIQRIEFVLQRKGGGEALEQVDFLSVPSCLVCACRSRQVPSPSPHRQKFRMYTEETSFPSNLMVYFQRPSLLLPTVNMLGAGGSLPEQQQWKELLQILLPALLPLLQSTTDSLRWDKPCCEGRAGIWVGTGHPSPWQDIFYECYLFNHMIF